MASKIQKLTNFFRPTKVRYIWEDEDFITLQIRSTVHENVPRALRTELWSSVLLQNGVGVQAAEKYIDLVKQKISKDVILEIQKDVTRTFPDHELFAQVKYQKALGRILKAYAAFDKDVGYCQGMNFVAGLLLTYLSEPNAFGALVVLLQEKGLRGMYTRDMGMVQKLLCFLNELMEQQLREHLESLGALPVLYASPWFISCFSSEFPLPFAARILDAILTQGYETGLLKPALGFVHSCRKKLLQMNDIEHIVRHLKQTPIQWEIIELHDVLTDVFQQPWNARQRKVLKDQKVETVAEAVIRVEQKGLNDNKQQSHHEEILIDNLGHLCSSDLILDNQSTNNQSQGQLQVLISQASQDFQDPNDLGRNSLISVDDDLIPASSVERRTEESSDQSCDRQLPELIDFGSFKRSISVVQQPEQDGVAK